MLQSLDSVVRGLDVILKALYCVQPDYQERWQLHWGCPAHATGSAAAAAVCNCITCHVALCIVQNGHMALLCPLKLLLQHTTADTWLLGALTVRQLPTAVALWASTTAHKQWHCGDTNVTQLSQVGSGIF